MHPTMMPLADCPRETLAAVEGVLTDIDETVSTHSRLTAEAYEAMEALKKVGFRVVPVTGRPAGWCDHIARFWPVDAVVGENGAFWMWHDDKEKRLRTRFVQSEAERADGRRRLEAVRAQVLRDVPGAGIASDQPYRAADLAIDFCEDVPALPHAEIVHIVKIFEAHGAHAKVSSIHVNGWFGDYDKLTTSHLMMRELFGIDLEAARARFAQRCADVRLLSQRRGRGQRARLRDRHGPPAALDHRGAFRRGLRRTCTSADRCARVAHVAIIRSHVFAGGAPLQWRVMERGSPRSLKRIHRRGCS
jgi:HAD superfamily hydrolase (TIGR01484 family)